MKPRKNMFLPILALGLMVFLVLSACSPSPSSQGGQGDEAVITVYKSPT